MVPWEQATVHVLAHGLHYGSSIFEGIRAYDTPEGSMIFRLGAHVRRMFDSAKIYRMTLPHDAATISRACREVVRANGLRSAYIRPIAYHGLGSLSVAPSHDTPVEVSIAAVNLGAYLGTEALEQGVDVCVSSWTRGAPNTTPAMAKASGQYLGPMLIADEAHRHVFVEGIALDSNGQISEGSGENLFVVRDGILYTPPAAASILMGITRDSAITLAKSLGIEVREQAMPREMLYVADEAFFTGTAAEITPIRSVDGIRVGRGEPGGVTRSLQRAFFGLFAGETRDRWGWLDPIEEELHVHVAGTNGTSEHANGGAAAGDRPRRTARARWPTEPCPW
jgi:branched-chain amino acid aminotransferase